MIVFAVFAVLVVVVVDEGWRGGGGWDWARMEGAEAGSGGGAREN